jgi:hypothetical protein
LNVIFVDYRVVQALTELLSLYAVVQEMFGNTKWVIKSVYNAMANTNPTKKGGEVGYKMIFGQPFYMPVKFQNIQFLITLNILILFYAYEP